MKKIYLTIASIATAVLCIIGLLYHIGYLDSLFGGASGEKSGNGKLTDSLSLSAFTDVDIDVSVADLNFEYSPSGEYRVSYDVSAEKYVPTVKVSGKTLKITQKVKNVSSNSASCRIVITIPTGSALDSVEIDAGVGNMQIDSLTAKAFDLDAGVGDVKITDSTIDSFKVNAGVGNVVLKNNTFTQLDIKAGMGNVEVTGTGDLSEYTLDIDHGLGALTVNGKSMSGFGSEYTQSGSTSKKITIEAGMGNVVVEE